MLLLPSLKRFLISRVPLQPERRQLLESMPKGSVCAEIGVYRGHFSSAILEVVQPRKLHLIDAWAFQPLYRDSWFGGPIGGNQRVMEKLYRQVCWRFAEEIEEGRVVLHRGFSVEVAPSFPDKYFDWVYIDANHMYDAVKTDLQMFYPKVKSNGFITGDNYGARADWWWKDGVKRAVDEFAAAGFCLDPQISNDQFIMQKTGVRSVA